MTVDILERRYSGLLGHNILFDNVIVGYIAVADNNPEFDMLYDFEIFKEHRRKGYAEMFLRQLSRHKTTRLCVVRNNYPAISLYFKVGFEIIANNSYCYIMTLKPKKNAIQRRNKLIEVELNK